MKVLFVADIHIKLGQRKVPKGWQANRYHMLVDELNKVECDLMILGGDTFDKAEASLEEIELYFELISKIQHPTLIFCGNHELKTKTSGILHNLAEETNRCNPKVEFVGTGYRSTEFDIIDYVELHQKSWKPQKSKLLFTHVRAELPAHMKQEPEIDLSKFDTYSLVISGDLHSHQMSQMTENKTPIIYPGSPLTTSFHREIPSDANGYIIVDTSTLEWEWYDLSRLPQLVRKKVTSEDEMIEDPYHRVVYELEGDLQSLGKVKDSELLDKKINTKVSKEAKLQLEDKTLDEELVMYLDEVESLPESTIKRLITRFKSAVHTS